MQVAAPMHNVHTNGITAGRSSYILQHTQILRYPSSIVPSVKDGVSHRIRSPLKLGRTQMKDSPYVFSSGDKDNSVARDGYLKVTSEFIRPPFKLLGQLAGGRRSFAMQKSGYHARKEKAGPWWNVPTLSKRQAWFISNAMVDPLSKRDPG